MCILILTRLLHPVGEMMCIARPFVRGRYVSFLISFHRFFFAHQAYNITSIGNIFPQYHVTIIKLYGDTATGLSSPPQGWSPHRNMRMVEHKPGRPQ